MKANRENTAIAGDPPADLAAGTSPRLDRNRS
jgi:hypothetical protein